VRLLARRAAGLFGGLRAVASCKGQLVPMTSLKDGAMGRMLGLGCWGMASFRAYRAGLPLEHGRGDESWSWEFRGYG
jgi:hypothetical protein